MYIPVWAIVAFVLLVGFIINSCGKTDAKMRAATAKGNRWKWRAKSYSQKLDLFSTSLDRAENVCRGRGMNTTASELQDLSRIIREFKHDSTFDEYDL